MMTPDGPEGPDFTSALQEQCSRQEACVYAAARLFCLAYESGDDDQAFDRWNDLEDAVYELADAIETFEKALGAEGEGKA